MGVWGRIKSAVNNFYGGNEEDYDDDGYRVDRRADRQQREMPSNSWRMRQRDR